MNLDDHDSLDIIHSSSKDVKERKIKVISKETLDRIKRIKQIACDT